MLFKSEQRVYDMIGEVVYVDKEKHWAKDTAIGSYSLYWERRGFHRQKRVY